MSRSKTHRTKPCPCGDYAIGPKLYTEGWEDGHMTKCPKMTLDGYLAVMASRAPSKKEAVPNNCGAKGCEGHFAEGGRCPSRTEADNWPARTLHPSEKEGGAKHD